MAPSLPKRDRGRKVLMVRVVDVACVQDGRAPLVGGADARAALAIALAARYSLQEGRPVSVQEEGIGR